MKRRALLTVIGLLVGAMAGSPKALAAGVIFKSSVTGNPDVKSIEVIRFGPQGVLLVGDGRGSQVIAIDTGDATPRGTLQSAIERIDDKLAGRLGTTAKNIKINDMVVNPASGVVYFSVLKQDERKPVILTVDGSGKIGEFALDNVKYARLPLPAGDKGPVTRITDLSWADDRVLVAGSASEEFASKLVSIPVPLVHEAKGSIYSAETYHVSHGRWETRAPMSSLMPFRDAGRFYVVGAFSCTPVVKYPLDELQSGAKAKGLSVIELGSGNRPLRMFSYEKDGKPYVLMNTFRFHHAKSPVGPSPYWTVRIEQSLLTENEAVNEKAVRRLDKKSPAAERIQVVEAYHGVMNLDKLDANRALVIRDDGEKGLTLTPLPLP
ncbi:MAG: hypothetical protein NZ700_13525 [Gemmataceae bacterium]|nr:hypothetical protein [Gemmataceae bacterium]MDW8265339.1 hypothetical protein [Gemmataceae bacterium]